MTNRKCTILVVEDNKPIRDIMRMGLEFEGYAVSEAGDGSEALSLLGQGPLPDVILLDLLMPGMNGYEFLKHVKADADSAASRVPIFITSAAGTSPMDQLPVQEIFDKPVDFEELYAAIRRVCG